MSPNDLSRCLLMNLPFSRQLLCFWRPSEHLLCEDEPVNITWKLCETKKTQRHLSSVETSGSSLHSCIRMISIFD